ncbi:hypothetical protein GGX14DRAFT_392449 [Mycena pura]|uniref:Uncharacterized protein n=1 Tax=Mycena pura TaxID=153505 RepID=A0AAD6YFM5_9AGAR|nr:hypothetical protein GGX14DRAFT_392449 [Mycena pura]
MSTKLLRIALRIQDKVKINVGSGTGLLETLLLQRHPHRTNSGSFLGVEVAQACSISRILLKANTAVVLSTWAVVSGEAERRVDVCLPAAVRAGTGVPRMGNKCGLDRVVAVSARPGIISQPRSTTELTLAHIAPD